MSLNSSSEKLIDIQKYLNAHGDTPCGDSHWSFDLKIGDTSLFYSFYTDYDFAVSMMGTYAGILNPDSIVLQP